LAPQALEISPCFFGGAAASYLVLALWAYLYVSLALRLVCRDKVFFACGGWAYFYIRFLVRCDVFELDVEL
jgi:hypothetical protein